MARFLFHRAIWCTALAGICLSTSAPALAQCCGGRQPTLTENWNDADAVIYGHLENLRFLPGDGEGTYAAEFYVHTPLKPHPAILSGCTITLSKHQVADPLTRNALVFFEVAQGAAVPFHVTRVSDASAVVTYMKDASRLAERPAAERLRFFFDYLENGDGVIVHDAHLEFAYASDHDSGEVARKLPAEKIVKWLANSDTPHQKVGLYASLLGYCGTEKHAGLLRDRLDRKLTAGFDRVLISYVMLKSHEGWEYALKVLKDDKREFIDRYGALRAARFLWDSDPRIIARYELVQGVRHLVDQADIADIAIEQLRSWRRWELTETVLGLLAKKTHKEPIVQRAIMRFALSCPNETAKQFVKSQRAVNPSLVAEVQGLLELDPDSLLADNNIQ